MPRVEHPVGRAGWKRGGVWLSHSGTLHTPCSLLEFLRFDHLLSHFLASESDSPILAYSTFSGGGTTEGQRDPKEG